jgi:hypothetical protein
MISSGKCPKCEKIIQHAVIEALPIHQSFQAKWLGVSYACPHCNTILSIGIDPVALKTDTISGLLEALRK